MAGRPLKQGLDYFSLDVDFFQSAKVRKIIKAQGTRSISVLICLLANIYRKDGYFLRWDGDMPFLIAEEIGAEEGVVIEVLSKALSVDFFDAGIFDKYGVLTSEGVQERFFSAIERRTRIEIVQEIFLLNPSEVSKNAVWKNATTMPFFRKKCDLGINADNNSNNVGNNSIFDDTNAQSKGKESKGKERKEVAEGIDADNNSIIADRNANNVGNNSIYADNNSISASKNEIHAGNPPAATIPKAVLDSYQTEIRPICSQIELEKLADDAERYGEVAVIKAIERAAIRGKRNIGYMEGILRRWEQDGYDEEGSLKRQDENPQIAMAKRAIDLLRSKRGEGTQ